MEVVTIHGDDDVEVDLHLMGDALFDGEEVRFMAAVPPEKLADREKEGGEDKDEGGIATGGGAAGVGGFGFGWRGKSVSNGCGLSNSSCEAQLLEKASAIARRGSAWISLRKASNVLIFSLKPPVFSPKALSSRPWSAKPFIVL